VLLLGARHLRDALRRWRLSVVVRFAAVLLVAEELLFFRLPFKPVHLLPVVAAVALLAGAAPLANRRWLVALVAAQLIAALVGTTLAAPDHPDGAESGSVELHLTKGVLLNDIHCRLEDRRRGPWPTPTDPAANVRAAANFSCQRNTWRAVK
jgi:hypothetical protein